MPSNMHAVVLWVLPARRPSSLQVARYVARYHFSSRVVVMMLHVSSNPAHAPDAILAHATASSESHTPMHTYPLAREFALTRRHASVNW